MMEEHERVVQIVRDYLKIIGCGNCNNTKHPTICRGCSNKTSSSSYWCISDEYAWELAHEIELIYK